MTEEDQYDEEDGRTLDERMWDAYGTRSEWRKDAEEETDWYANAYRNFLENGCRGTLTYEQAVEEYKNNTGSPHESVTSWPELDWVKRQREKCADSEEYIRAKLGLSLDEFYAVYWPYEPMLRYAY